METYSSLNDYKQLDAMFGDGRASSKKISLLCVRLQAHDSAVSEATKMEMRMRTCSHPTPNMCKARTYWVSSARATHEF